MDESDDYVIDYEEEDMAEAGAAWWSPASLLSPEASAITALALAVVGVIGGGFISFGVAQALVGFGGGPDEMRLHVVVTAGIVLLLLLGVVGLARRVLVDDAVEIPAWSRHLAASAVVVSAVGTALSAVTVVGGLLQRPEF
jgi:hypothetical protein